MELDKPFRITKVLNSEDLASNKVLIDKFFELYINQANFPDPAEREDVENIKERIMACPVKLDADFIKRNNPNPFTHLLCLERVDEVQEGELVAGCIVEFYPLSSCALITYVFIHPGSRGKPFSYIEEKTQKSVKRGIGEILLEDQDQGLPSLIDYFNAEYVSRIVKGGNVNAVFFESNNPLKTDTDSMPPHKRLKFFRKVGAKWLNFDYVQPPIGTGQPPVDNLFLLTLPHFNGVGQDFVPVVTVMRFVLELAKSLDKNQDREIDRYGDHNFYKDIDKLKYIDKLIVATKEKHTPIHMANYLRDEYHLSGYPSQKEDNILQKMFESLINKAYPGTDIIYLSEIPRTEEPKFQYKRASVTMHVLVDEDYFRVNSYMLNESNGHWVKPQSRLGYVESDNRAQESMPQSELHYCSICHSFETDLFSYHNQFNPPYFTKSYLSDAYVLVQFPERLAFTSEGRLENMLIPQSYQMDKSQFRYEREHASSFDYVPLRLFVSYTYFLQSNIRVWNITFTSSEDLPVNEFTLIKLAKFFTGSQENKSLQEKQGNLLDTIKFARCSQEQAKHFKLSGNHNLSPDAFQPLPSALFGSHSIIDVTYSISSNGEDRLKGIYGAYPFFDGAIGYKNIKTGTVQIDMSEGLADMILPKAYTRYWHNYLSEFFEEVYYTIKPNLSQNIKDAPNDNQRFIQVKNRFSEEIAQVLCGTTLGIFDFDRMGFEEVEDTLTPRLDSVKKYSFLTINRGALTSYHVEKDSVLNSAWNNLGVNPYLIIPNAVLTHNEYVLLDADELLNSLLKDLKEHHEGISLEPEISVERRNNINRLLSEDYLNNVFHYKTERDLYDYGSTHRGIVGGMNNAIDKLKQVDTLIDQHKDRRNRSYQRTVETIAFIIGLTTLYGFLKELFTLLPLKKESFLTIVFFVPLAIIILGIFMFKQHKNRDIRKIFISTSAK